MAYTQSNLTDVESVIVDLAKDKRVVRVTIEVKSIEYSQTNIEELKNLRAARSRQRFWQQPGVLGLCSQLHVMGCDASFESIIFSG